MTASLKAAAGWEAGAASEKAGGTISIETTLHVESVAWAALVIPGLSHVFQL